MGRNDTAGVISLSTSMALFFPRLDHPARRGLEEFVQMVLFVTHDIEGALRLADTVYVMTARPGRIKKCLTVDLSRPRALEVTTSPYFNELKREVLALIREESLKAASER
jgi:ABC-type nitrate/sulfonate/bicarbonate transport system ATPase subunit